MVTEQVVAGKGMINHGDQESRLIQDKEETAEAVLRVKAETHMGQTVHPETEVDLTTHTDQIVPTEPKEIGAGTILTETMQAEIETVPRETGTGFSSDGNYSQRDGNRASANGNKLYRDGNRSDTGNFNRDFREKPKYRNNRSSAPYKKTGKPKRTGGDEIVPVKREFNDAGEMRLNRYLAHAGISSRRQADDYIKAGLVTVNGVVVTEMGVKIKRGDDIRYNGERLATEKKVYILVNKPKDYVTTTDDEQGRKTVLDLVANACPERVYPVGRLDRNTTGVMLLTNDGDLAGKLTHPKYNKKKIYHVVLDKNLKQTDLESIAKGITLEDGLIQPDAVSIVSPEKKNEVGIEIHSGRNRIVRRIFEQLGYEIVRLDRVYFAGLTKKNLARGKWRFLSDNEINMLLMNSYE